MATEFKLSYTAAQVNEKLGKIDSLATTDYVDSAVENIDIATDDEIIDMLIQEDVLPVVVDSDGAILSDENGDILLW